MTRACEPSGALHLMIPLAGSAKECLIRFHDIAHLNAIHDVSWTVTNPVSHPPYRRSENTAIPRTIANRLPIHEAGKMFPPDGKFELGVIDHRVSRGGECLATTFALVTVLPSFCPTEAEDGFPFSSARRTLIAVGKTNPIVSHFIHAEHVACHKRDKTLAFTYAHLLVRVKSFAVLGVPHVCPHNTIISGQVPN